MKLKKYFSGTRPIMYTWSRCVQAFCKVSTIYIANCRRTYYAK